MSERIGCKHCNFKGYVKHFFAGGPNADEESVSVSICSHCKDARGYYAYVRNKYGHNKDDNIVQLVEEDTLATVLDFNEFKRKRKTKTED